MLKTYLYVPEKLNKAITTLAKEERLSKAEVIRAAIAEGLKQIKEKRSGSAEVLLRIAKLAKRNKVSGPRDSSTGLDKYLWSEAKN